MKTIWVSPEVKEKLDGLKIIREESYNSTLERILGLHDGRVEKNGGSE